MYWGTCNIYHVLYFDKLKTTGFAITLSYTYFIELHYILEYGNTNPSIQFKKGDR